MVVGLTPARPGVKYELTTCIWPMWMASVAPQHDKCKRPPWKEALHAQRYLCVQEVAQHDFAFEDVVSKPAHQLQILAQELGLHPKVGLTA